MKKNLIKLSFTFLLFILFVLPVSTASGSNLKVDLPKKTGAYKPGDTIKISWTPATELIQNILLIPVKKDKDIKGYNLYSDMVNGDPVITSGFYNYIFDSYSIPSGSYLVGLGLSGSRDISAISSKKLILENKPSLYFGTAKGEVNSIAISKGSNVELKWDAKSVKNCNVSSYPKNSKWSKTVKSSGTKKIRVLTPTTFYINCKNSLGETSASLEVNTEAPEYSNAKLVPSTTFSHYNFRLGTTQNEAIKSETSIVLFNSSDTETIYFNIVNENQPKWVNTGYNTSQLSLQPNGTVGVGAFADPSMVNKVGDYKWDLKIEGNFSNSPLIIPITMTITK